MSNYKTKLSLLALLMGTANSATPKVENEELAVEESKAEEEVEGSEEEPEEEYHRYIRDASFFSVGIASTLCTQILWKICFGKVTETAPAKGKETAKAAPKEAANPAGAGGAGDEGKVLLLMLKP